jgi:hypothetical protein
VTQASQVFTDQGWQPRILETALATASGTIDALGNVTINTMTGNIRGITANIGANTLTVQFENNFDPDGIYFTVGFVYQPGVGTSPFLPVTQTSDMTVYMGTYPGIGPWNFCIFAIANS